MKPLHRIDFDDAKFCKEHKDELVQINLGTLAVLLDYYYTGGAEPATLTERLKEAKHVCDAQY